VTGEAHEALERVGIRPGDAVTSNASSGLPLFRDKDRWGPLTIDQLPFAWFPPGGLGLVLAVALSHADDCEARPALMLMARAVGGDHVVGWTTETWSFESLTGWRMT
jgi:hypothetical protein